MFPTWRRLALQILDVGTCFIMQIWPTRAEILNQAVISVRVMFLFLGPFMLSLALRPSKTPIGNLAISAAEQSINHDHLSL
jgi:hypothetical protein